MRNKTRRPTHPGELLREETLPTNGPKIIGVQLIDHRHFCLTPQSCSAITSQPVAGEPLFLNVISSTT